MTRILTIAGWFLCVYLSHTATFPSSIAAHDNSLSNGASDSELRIQKDQVTSFRVVYPTDGAMYTIPIEFRAEIGVESVDEYNTYCKDKILCVEIDGGSAEKQCTLLANPNIVFEELPTGNFTARAFITNSKDGNFRYHESSSTSFSVVDEEELAAHTAEITTANREKEMELLQWSEWRQTAVKGELNTDKELLRFIVADLVAMNGGKETFLVIGVKTAVVKNFAQRQAIRETWASSQALPPGVKVIFLGCTPKFTAQLSAQEQEQIQKAVDLEKQTYGDLLTDELHCEDSYDDLPNKVKHFLQFASQAFPQTPFVMVADDDIYIRSGRLVDELRMGNPSERLYTGQVWDQLLGHSQAPVRDATERYYISEEHYPLRSYPPFAFGAHYLLSMDCARFIAKNSDRLRGIGGMDDVSIAMWLLTMQVHVEHTSSFSSLQLRGCENGLIALSDLTAFGIRSVHANLIDNRSLCFDFDRNTWQLNEPMVVEIELIFPRDTFIPLEFQVFVHDISSTKYLEVTVVISVPGKNEVSISHHPSAETLQFLVKRVCSQAQKVVGPSVLSCHHFAIVLRSVLRQQFQTVETAARIDQAHLEMWRHNLYHTELNAPPLIIGYSKFAVYSAIVFECLLTSAFKHLKRPIVVVSEKVLNDRYESKPDVFVFSVLDRKCEPMSKPGCARYYLDKYASATGGNNVMNPTKFMMISGETETTEGLDEHVLLLSTVSGIQRKNYAYVSVASTSFGERLNHIPITLLSPTASKFSEMTTERRFCAYLYARCDRPQREYMFDLLNSIEPVDALGVCAGSSRRPDEMHFKSRYSTWYNDDAVTTFEHYKFVIAFENGAVPGYVTEKLINPFLAGSIPIYLGSSTVSELFNPDSFIDCGRFQKLAACASYVMEVHNSPELYAKMRNEPAIRNVTAFNDAFSWHPSVPSRTMAEKVAEILSKG